jgi:hypothetical protein
MREPSRRELFLQNRLALSSTLLFSTVQVLSGKSNEDRRALIIECETFFSETARLLAAEIEAEMERAESPISAPPAEKYGVALNWVSPNGPPQSTPVPCDAACCPGDDPSSPALSSASSPGGIPSTEIPWQVSLIARIQTSFITKPSGV